MRAEWFTKSLLHYLSCLQSSYFSLTLFSGNWGIRINPITIFLRIKNSTKAIFWLNVVTENLFFRNHLYRLDFEMLCSLLERALGTTSEFRHADREAPRYAKLMTTALKHISQKCTLNRITKISLIPLRIFF